MCVVQSQHEASSVWHTDRMCQLCAGNTGIKYVNETCLNLEVLPELQRYSRFSEGGKNLHMTAAFP